MTVDVEALKAKNDIVEVIGRYVPLTRRGKDFWACCPFHQESTPSFVCHPPGVAGAGADGYWKCHAGCGGGDVISFLENYCHTDFQGAVKILQGSDITHTVNGNGRPKAEWIPKDEPPDLNLPAPEDAPPCRFVHQGLGAPAMAWAYRDRKGNLLGYDSRYEDGKGNKTKVLPWRWINGGWITKGFAAPSPLYGLETLSDDLKQIVLIVEGCKAADAARQLFNGLFFAVVTWQGGCSNVQKADLTPLAGHPILLWPDADSEKKKLLGQKAMLYLGNKLIHMCPKVTYFDPNPTAPCSECDGTDSACPSCEGLGRVYLLPPMPDGWDAADAVEERWDAAKWKEWANARVKPLDIHAVDSLIADEKEKTKKLKDKVEKKKRDFPAQFLPHQALWLQWGLKMRGDGMPYPSLDNISMILEKDPYFGAAATDGEDEGVMAAEDAAAKATFVYRDTFLHKTFNCHSNREWADEDEVNLLLYMQRNMGIQSCSRNTIAEAIIATAFKDERNCVKEWLETLVWDQEERLEEFFPEYFGTGRTPYTAAVGRCFLTSLVARAYLPGCKADHMIVLEGAQGIRKSSAMEALVGSAWYADVNESVTSKDFFQGIQGKWLIEIGEMGSFDKSDREAVKQMLSRRTDRYRDSYGRYSSDHSRQSIFAGTTNRDNWNKDESGARRFWPLRCRRIDIQGLTAIREQLFAEAVARFKRVDLLASEADRVRAGADWWVTPGEETKREQEARYDDDPWTAPIYEFIRGKFEVTVSELLTDTLKIETGRQGPGEQRRVGAILRHAGWVKQVEREEGAIRTNRVWRPRTDEYEL